jgi:hypothetical protein
VAIPGDAVASQRPLPDARGLEHWTENARGQGARRGGGQAQPRARQRGAARAPGCSGGSWSTIDVNTAGAPGSPGYENGDSHYFADAGAGGRGGSASLSICRAMGVCLVGFLVVIGFVFSGPVRRDQ